MWVRQVLARCPTAARHLGPHRSAAGARARWELIYSFPDSARPHPEVVTEVPPELIRFFHEHRVPRGPAVDIGSGPGVVTEFLARRTGSAIAVDFASNAVREARDALASGGHPPLGIVAAAPNLPFADESFAFVFDRGCMHLLPPEQWEAYLATIGRLLKVGGYAQLIQHTVTESVVAKLAPPQLIVASAEAFGLTTHSGGRRRMVSVVLRRVR
jgi:SAM-dependent methyltransferase